MTGIKKEEFEVLRYHVFLDKCLKKNKLNILGNPTGFVRGIPKQLADDMFILALDRIGQELSKETLERLKYICEYFLSQKSKRRITIDNDENRFIYDKFSVYENQLEQIKSLLKQL